METEQFSLCWNNFHNNLSSGFHSLLQDEDLVDVTLAAEGRYVKAHKTVLSVCSPYFKELFRVNPCKHPIVILQDVKYAALNSLLQFMYQGEVSVSQEEIPAFMKVAEMLKVKGLTEQNSADKNSIENNGFRTASSPFGPPSDTKPQLLKRRPLRKLLRPVQHLRPLESPNTIRSPPAVTSPQPPPPKKPYMEQKSPEHTSQMGFNPKREPVEPPADEESGDPLMDEQMEMSSVMDSSAGRITPSQMSTIWKPDLSRNANDTSSPDIVEQIVIRTETDDDNDMDDGDDHSDDNKECASDHEYIIEYVTDAEECEPKKDRWWSNSATTALIDTYEIQKRKYKNSRNSEAFWQAVEDQLLRKGIKLPHSPRIKWQNLIRTYKLARANLEKNPDAKIRFPFYERMAGLVNSRCSID